MIKFHVNAAKLDAKLATLEKNGPAMLRAVDAFARVLRTRIQLTFVRQQSPTGAPWKPLKYRLGQALRHTGRLYGSVQVRREGDAVVVGTNLKIPGNGNSLGAVHQFGMTIRPKKGQFLRFAIPGRKGFVFAREVTIPSRPFMPMDAAGNVALPPAWEKSAINAMAAALGLDK